MAKDIIYFSHDSNARNDEKILALRMKYKWEGYGLYWALIEKLREGTCYKLTADYNLLSFDLRTDSALIKSIINDFGLFSFTDNGECFYSESLCERMKIKDQKSEKASLAANKRWGKDADVMQTHSQSTAPAMQVKESKVKEVKENDAREEDFETAVFKYFFPNREPGMPAFIHQERLISNFCTAKRNTGEYEEFKRQFQAFRIYMTKGDNGNFKPTLKNYLGNPDAKAGPYSDGKWNQKNYVFEVQGQQTKRRVIDHSKP